MISSENRMQEIRTGASHFLWSGGNTTNPPIEEVGPMFVFNTAFDGEQGGWRPLPARDTQPFSTKKNGMHPIRMSGLTSGGIEKQP